MDFFAIASLILSHLELSRIELSNLISSILMEFFQRLDFLKSLSLSQMHLDIVLKSLVSILSRQVISLKKMMVSSAKFTILISWSPVCIPLILLLALMKLASTSAAIMCKSIENRHPWQTSGVG